jgi:hypothetical protein
MMKGSLKSVHGLPVLMTVVAGFILMNGGLLVGAEAHPTKQAPEFWDTVVICFAKNYRKMNPGHFMPQMPDSVCNIFALQNVIPSVMNLDPNLLEVVIKHVMKLHGNDQPVNLLGWSSAEIVQAMTDALNHQIHTTNKANGYEK